MFNYFISFIYFSVIILLLWQAFKAMSGGLLSINSQQNTKKASKSDRTGLLTVHPELLNEEGRLTDEDLLTVRFSNEVDPPKSLND